MRKVIGFTKQMIGAMLVFALVLILVYTPASAAKKVKLNKVKVTLRVGKTVTLKLKNNKKKVKWSSSNKKIATVTQKGKVKAKKAGKATITAKVGKKKYKCKVIVQGKLKDRTSTKVTPAPISTSTPPINDKPISTPTSAPTPMPTSTPTPTPVEVTDVLLDSNSESILVGDTITLCATLIPENTTNKTIIWTSSDDTIATVSSTGLVEGRSAGTTVITASLGNCVASCEISVLDRLETIDDTSNYTMYQGDSVTIPFVYRGNEIPIVKTTRSKIDWTLENTNHNNIWNIHIYAKSCTDYMVSTMGHQKGEENLQISDPEFSNIYFTKSFRIYGNSFKCSLSKSGTICNYSVYNTSLSIESTSVVFSDELSLDGLQWEIGLVVTVKYKCIGSLYGYCGFKWTLYDKDDNEIDSGSHLAKLSKNETGSTTIYPLLIEKLPYAGAYKLVFSDYD